MSYESINNQPSRLGEFADFADFGQGGDVAAAINAVAGGIVGTTRAITEAKTLQTQSKDQRKVAIFVANENTKKLRISTSGASEQARIDIQRVKATYGSMTKLILGGGAVLAAIILTGAFAYSIAT